MKKASSPESDLSKREIVAHDDPNGSTKIGWAKWEAYRKKQLAQMKPGESNAGATWSKCRALFPDFEIKRSEQAATILFLATWAYKRAEFSIYKGEDEADARRTLIKQCLEVMKTL